MRIVIFLVCICFLLLSGGNYACVPGHRAAIHHIEKKQQVKFVNNNQRVVVIADGIFNDQNEYLIEEEDEDENVNRTNARKFTLVNNGHLTRFPIVNVSNLNNGRNASRPYYNLLSSKYILQRVLRI